MEILNLIINYKTELTVGAVAAIVFRAVFTFGFLMQWGQMLFRLKKERKWNPAIQLLAYVWLVCMFVSAVIDIVINITLMAVLFWDKPTSWNETFSYRIGRYVHNSKYYGNWRRTIALPICRILTALEGENHCMYVYGAIPSPYPDVRILF